jgi:hypothetical protein
MRMPCRRREWGTSGLMIWSLQRESNSRQCSDPCCNQNSLPQLRVRMLLFIG